MVNSDIVQRMGVLENDLAKKMVIDEMTADDHKISIALERNTAKIVTLAEELQIATNQIEWLEAEVHKLNMDICNKKQSLDVKSTEIADLTDRLRLSTIKNEELEADIVSLVTLADKLQRSKCDSC
jgi:chromosome segregation ATPase